MNKIFIISMLAITILFFTGCGLFSNPTTLEPSEVQVPEEQMPAGQAPKPIIPAYEIIDKTDLLPVEIAEIIDPLKSRRGYFVFKTQENSSEKEVFVLISSGERPTGGYFIEVKTLSFKNGTLEVVVEEKEPDTEGGVIQVITYPWVLLKIFDSYENVTVLNQDNQRFEKMVQENM
jgi:hypothetical protein